jgi:hypothetical protein
MPTDRFSSRPAILAIVLLAIAFLFIGRGVSAQQVTGSVLHDSDSSPIPEVEVTALNERGGRIGRSVRTDSAGRFVLPGVSGRIRVRAQRVGFAITESPILEVAADETLVIELFMRAAVAPLLPVRVVERRRTPSLVSMDEFERRKESGQGVYITREEITHRNPQSFADLMLGMAGVQVIRGGGPPIVQMRRPVTSIRQPDNTCIPRYYLDGVLLAAGPESAAPVMSLGAGELQAVEVYRGSATVPAEFGGSASQCGVIVVWTIRSAPPAANPPPFS